MAVAAATPVPVLLMLNSVGTMVCTVAVKVCVVEPLVASNVATPGPVPSGTTKLICEGDAYTNPAGARDARRVRHLHGRAAQGRGQGQYLGVAVTAARFEPNRVANEPGATALVVAAEDVIGLGVITP